MNVLLLWDIDGTLLKSGAAGMRALQRAFNQEFVNGGSLSEIDFSGRTDRWIMRRIFEKFTLEPSEQNFSRLQEAYLRALPEALKQGQVQVLPGAREILEQAPAHPNVVHGLLTGNLLEGARQKLSHVDLWRHFPFGGFGDDAELRNEIGPHALRRGREHHLTDFRPDQVWVIGDTPHDIECAKAIGANSLAAATGRHSLAELESCHPTVALADLSDTAGFWKLVERVVPTAL
jgi:phosphoglycolate phosphatase-like HAD superfamily hydrolase